jgi:hypothetical protein
MLRYPAAEPEWSEPKPMAWGVAQKRFFDSFGPMRTASNNTEYRRESDMSDSSS